MKASTFNRRRHVLARLAVVAVTVVAGMAFATASSAQASTCSFSNGALNLNLSDLATGTTIQTANGTIVITTGGPVTCAGGTPTTSNTDVVRVLDVSDDENTPAPGDGSSTLIVREPETFGPGITPEPAPGKGEVEFVVNMGAGREPTPWSSSRIPRAQPTGPQARTGSTGTATTIRT